MVAAIPPSLPSRGRSACATARNVTSAWPGQTGLEPSTHPLSVAAAAVALFNLVVAYTVSACSPYDVDDRLDTHTTPARTRNHYKLFLRSLGGCKGIADSFFLVGMVRYRRGMLRSMKLF